MPYYFMLYELRVTVAPLDIFSSAGILTACKVSCLSKIKTMSDFNALITEKCVFVFGEGDTEKHFEVFHNFPPKLLH